MQYTVVSLKNLWVIWVDWEDQLLRSNGLAGLTSLLAAKSKVAGVPGPRDGDLWRVSTTGEPTKKTMEHHHFNIF